jgi:ribosomal protein S18 acetylase RimI-like enzyme
MSAAPSDPDPFLLVSASSFSIEQLTAAYNQTRVDYLVPMPMNAARLAEYVHVYDVNLERSLVAMDGDAILGLAMIGVRPGRVWVTRLGVLPVKRRRGAGEALMRGLLAAGEQPGIHFAVLEVIKHNDPAHALFVKLGFRETQELLVLRRPPGAPRDVPPAQVRWLDRVEMLAALESRATPSAWTHEAESFAKAQYVLGLALTLPDGGSGWLAFQRQTFVLQRLILVTERGDPRAVGRALLAHLYQQHPLFDTHAENIPSDDPHLPALLEAGFIESFRRIEMQRKFV